MLKRMLPYSSDGLLANKPHYDLHLARKFFVKTCSTANCLLVVVFFMMMSTVFAVQAQSFSAKSPSGHKLYYTVSGNTATVVSNESYNDYSGELKIPSYVKHKGTYYKVAAIGGKCFYDCKNIYTIHIPASVKTIQGLAFLGCKIYNVYYGGTLKEWISNEMGSQLGLTNNNTLYVEGYKKVTDVIIPDSITTVPSCAFHYTNITSVIFHENVVEIGEDAFWSCENLTHVKFNSPSTRINGRAFSFCTSLESIVLPSKLGYIGRETFYYCSKLRKVVWGDNMKIIGKEAFKKTALDSIVLPATLETIGKNAFEECKNLKCVINKSQHLTIVKGSDNNGGVAKYAEVVIDLSDGKPSEPQSQSLDMQYASADSQHNQDSVPNALKIEEPSSFVAGVKRFGVMTTDTSGNSILVVDSVFDEVKIFEGESGEFYQCKYSSYFKSNVRRYLPGYIVEFYDTEGKLITRDYENLLTNDVFPYDATRRYGNDYGLAEVAAAADIACGIYYEGKKQRREAYRSYMEAYKRCPSLTMAKENADAIVASMKAEQEQIRQQIEIEREIAAAEFAASMNALSASLQGLADAFGSVNTSSSSRPSTSTSRTSTPSKSQPKSNDKPKETTTHYKTCTYCNGTGESIEHTKAPGLVQDDRWCEKCRKVVHWWHSHQRCPICKGKGKVITTKR